MEEKKQCSSHFTDLAKVSNAQKPIEGRGSRTNHPPEVKLEMQKSLSANSGEVLDEVYAALGGVAGSKLYWLNHEEQFRTMIETKFLTKQVLKEAATAQGEEIGKNIFMTFIQNNGLQKHEPLPQVDATVVNPELEDKHG
jgi:hypothetical protein